MEVFRGLSPAIEPCVRRISSQLDRFRKNDLILGEYKSLGSTQRHSGGQAVVQFVRRPSDNREFAVKFYMDESAFRTEAGLYANFVPWLRQSTERMLHALEASGISQSGRASVTIEGIIPPASSGNSNPDQIESNSQVHSFLPRIESIHSTAVATTAECDSQVSTSNLLDPSGESLPPCIVMERGESLHDWVARAEPDRFATFWVLAHISSRMQCMHEAGYVHMDLKPANVILLPRDNKWTVIDFGCTTKIGAHAPLAFSVTYCPPEVMKEAAANTKTLLVSPAVDVWALGVMAFELLTGKPAFRIVTDGIEKVVSALQGRDYLPWEGPNKEEARKRLGSLRNIVLQMLHRDPNCRCSMKDLHDCLSRCNSS